MRRIIYLLLLILCQFAHVLASLWMLVAIIGHPNSRRALIIAMGYDQLANAATGGSPDETISSRANRARSEGKRWGCLLCWVLDRIDADHCKRSAGV